MIRKSVQSFVQKLLLVSFSAFLIWQSIQLVSNIVQYAHPTTLWDIVTQSVLLNLFITGIFLVGYALPLYRLLPASYYISVESQWFATTCAFLRIELFRKIMRLTFWNSRNNKRHFFDGTRAGLTQFENNTRISESSHSFAFVSIVVVSFYIGVVADIHIALIATLIDVIVNFYPAMLQRYHRLRLQTIRRHTTPQEESSVGHLAGHST